MLSNAPQSKAAAHPVTALFEPPLAAGQVRDPVCGMKVDQATAKHTTEQGGATYYFCSAGCQAKFVADPTRYTRPTSRPEIALG